MPQSRVRGLKTATTVALEELGRLLLGPILGRIDYPRIVFVGEGALHYIPFAALRLREKPPGYALLDEYEIVQIPSASSLVRIAERLDKRQSPPGLVAIFADAVFEREDPRLDASRPRVEQVATRTPEPRVSAYAFGERYRRLAASRVEALGIRDLAGDGEILLATDFDARRDRALEDRLAGFKILHFATHSLIDERHPESSGLILSLWDSDGQPVDGLLRVADLHTLQLQADLVVLRARAEITPVLCAQLEP